MIHLLENVFFETKGGLRRLIKSWILLSTATVFDWLPLRLPLTSRGAVNNSLVKGAKRTSGPYLHTRFT
jgi:hypothetical protein